MIVTTGKRAPPPFQRPTLTAGESISYERAFRAAKHKPIDVQGNIYTPGLGDLAGFSSKFAQAIARPQVVVTGMKPALFGGKGGMLGRIAVAAARPIPLPQMATANARGMMGRIALAIPQSRQPPPGMIPSFGGWKPAPKPSARLSAMAAALRTAQPSTLMIGKQMTGDLGDLAGATGIVAVDQVLDLYAAKAKKLESAMTIVTPASAIAALTGILLLMGAGGHR